MRQRSARNPMAPAEVARDLRNWLEREHPGWRREALSRRAELIHQAAGHWEAVARRYSIPEADYRHAIEAAREAVLRDAVGIARA